MLSVGNSHIRFEINCPGVIAVTSTIAFAAAVCKDPIFSFQNVTLAVISVGSWGYALATKSSKVFEKTMSIDQRFNKAFNEWSAAKKNLQDIQALSVNGDISDGSILLEEQENLQKLEVQLNTLYNALSSSQQKAYRGFPFLNNKN